RIPNAPPATPTTAATLPPPPQPVPYDQAAARRYEQQVQAEFTRIQNETEARVRQGEEDRRRKQQNIDRAFEAGMAPLMAYIEAKERERKAAEGRREDRRLQALLDQVAFDVRESIDDLNEDEAALMRVISRHPGLPADVREAIDRDLEEIRRLRQEKLALVDEYTDDFEDLIADARE